MRIGIDVTCWSQQRGYGRYVRCLVRELLDLDREHEYVLFFDSGGVPTEDLAARRVVVPISRPQAVAAAANGRRSVPDLLRMTAAVARERLDVFYSPTVYGYFPLYGVRAKVLTIHDAIAELHPAEIFASRRSRLFWRAKVWHARRQADRIVTVSEHARRDLCRVFGLAETAIAVVPDAADAIFQPPESAGEAVHAVAVRFAIAPPYLLYVGGFGPHKNLMVLLDVFARLVARPGLEAVSLVFAGEREADPFLSEVAALDARVAARGLGARVRFLGFVPDAALVALYQAANALVLPSLREGYGLPGVEAMSCGTPVVATRESALPEILGEAGLVIDPGKPAELERALEVVLLDASSTERMRLAAHARAGLFRWRRSAEQLLSIFESFAEV
jgi:glycosyltransferase involved in cell wall biosynthesis